MRKIDQLDLFSSSREGRAAAASSSGLLDVIGKGTLDRPLIVSVGMGIDAIAATIALVRMGARIDLAIFSDVGAEKQATYDYIPVFDAWLREHAGIPLTVCRYHPTTAAYETLEEECLHNGTLPGVAVGVASCSLKYKRAAIHSHLKGYPARGRRAAHPGWQPALDCWERGEDVVQVIGYDAGPKDSKRSSRDGDPGYQNFYVLRELGMTRLDCARLIISEGLPLPVKSACFFCTANKEAELLWIHHHEPDQFRRALRVETNALPKLHSTEGLWRKTRVGDQRPGNWRLWASQKGLITEDPSEPDGFRINPQIDPPAAYPDEEVDKLLLAELPCAA